MDKESIRLSVKFIRYEGKDIPLKSLLESSGRILDFLGEVAKYTGIELGENKWVVSRLESSTPCLVLASEPVTKESAQKYRNEAKKTIREPYKKEKGGEAISLSAKRISLGIPDPLDNNDSVELDFLDEDAEEKEAEVLSISKIDATREMEILKKIEDQEAPPAGIFEYYGGIRGKACEWHKEGYVTYVLIKNIETNEDIKCYYEDGMYDKIHEVFSKKDSILFISGKIGINQADNKIVRLDMEKIAVDENAQYYQEGDLDKFFGCAQGLTDGLSPREYIERIRHGDE